MAVKFETLFQLVLFITLSRVVWAQHHEVYHVISAIEEDRFHGWPANNGAWQWGDEFLVGFTQGDFDNTDGHNISGIQESKLTRSVDGGFTWQMFDPENFLDDQNIQWRPDRKKRLHHRINFADTGFAMRIFATGYHGNDDPEGGFYYSYDRGLTWRGPYRFGDLNSHPELKGKILTPRTDYIVSDSNNSLVFVTARTTGPQRIACVQMINGGLDFEFLAWITPYTHEYSAVMPSSVHLGGDQYLTAFRRINTDKSKLESTIETYLSVDRCRSWQRLSTIKEMVNNSNPPALLKLADGRLCCVYGDRDAGKIAGKYSSDGGRTWSTEFTVREGYTLSDDWNDMGYVRLLERMDGKLVAVYYWASPEHPQQHIAASIWEP